MEARQNELFSNAPEVAPGDVWGDAPCMDGSSPNPVVTLPPKRAKPEKSGGLVTGQTDGCLRLGSKVSFPQTDEAYAPLEVHEIDGSVVRLQPQEPEVMRMPRQIVFHERPPLQDAHALAGEASDWGRSKKQPLVWILGTGMAVAAMVVGAILLLPFINRSNAARPGQVDTEWVLEPIANAESLSDMLARQAEAERVFREFTNARSAEDVLPLVRDPDQVAALIRARQHPAIATKQGVPKTLAWGARERQALTYGILSGNLPDYSGFEAYFTVSEGRLVMDWKASTAYGTADFAQLAASQGNPAEIRGWITPADFYTLAFPESGFQAYQLSSPDRQQSIWVYARRGGEVHQKLKTLLKGGYILEGRKDPEKITVRLESGSADSLPGQWSLVEILHKEWIAP